MLEIIEKDEEMQKVLKVVEEGRLKLTEKQKEEKQRHTREMNKIRKERKALDTLKRRTYGRLYTKYIIKGDKFDYNENNACYRMFGKRKKDLTPEETKEYNRRMIERHRLKNKQ